MDPLLERIEVEPVPFAVGDDDLAVDDAAVGQRVGEHRQQLREISVERLLVAARELDVVAVTEDDAAEPVPLRFVQHAIGVGDRARQLGEHRFDRGLDRQAHARRSLMPVART